MRRPLLATVLLTTGICLALLLAWLPIGRWWELQRLGEVPEGASFATREGMRDWRIAAYTTWWGKKLDPRQFWKQRTIWNDDSAQSAALRRGRAYPPIPTHLTNAVPPFSISASRYKDVVAPVTGPDSGPYIPYHFSDAENAYWDWFAKTHPRPPAHLERGQFDLARRVLEGRKLGGLSAQERADLEAHERSDLQQMGFPPEALSEDALFWAYVVNKRQEYERMLNSGWSVGSGPIRNLLERLGVDSAFITRPLTSNQQHAAKAWKSAYLQRLRRERADESYINAYLKAWNLSPTEDFPNDQRE